MHLKHGTIKLFAMNTVCTQFFRYTETRYWLYITIKCCTCAKAYISKMKEKLKKNYRNACQSDTSDDDDAPIFGCAPKQFGFSCFKAISPIDSKTLIYVHSVVNACRFLCHNATLF